MSKPRCALVMFVGGSEEPVSAQEVLADLPRYQDQLDLHYGYGALRVAGGATFVSPSDRLVAFVPKLARAVSYLFEAEPETILWSESEHGLSLEPSGDDEAVLLFFAGSDPYEPEELLLPETQVDLAELCEDILVMGEQLCALAKAVDPASLEEDDVVAGLVGVVEMGRDALKTYKLEKQRGLR